MAENTQVVTPMSPTAGRICTCMAAKLTPAASASMEVARASGSIALGEKSGSGASSSPPKLSRSMLTPMKASSAKATQWLNRPIRPANPAPSR